MTKYTKQYGKHYEKIFSKNRESCRTCVNMYTGKVSDDINITFFFSIIHHFADTM